MEPARIRGHRQRWLTAALVLIVGLSWAMSYILTGQVDPRAQSQRLTVRVMELWDGSSGEKDQCHIAIFHLIQAAHRNFPGSRGEENCAAFPDSWQDLLRHVGDYQGPHLLGTLANRYPFLLRPHDPWGNPWIYRFNVVPLPKPILGQKMVQVTWTFGSPGPDGRECRVSTLRNATAVFGCDDIIFDRRYDMEPLWRILELAFSSTPEMQTR